MNKNKKITMTFLSLTDTFLASNLRLLSAYVKKHGFETKIIFLPRYESEGLTSEVSFLYPFSKKIIDQVFEICKDSDIVGLSMMSCHMDLAVYLTRCLKEKLNIPIIWGGIHPTIRPSECTKYADLVCVGEGEISLIKLLKGMSEGKNWTNIDIPGIIKKDTDQVTTSELLEDLGELPPPDFDFKNQYILYKNEEIVQLTPELLACYGNDASSIYFSGYSYSIAISRGCPYSCAYCCNNILKKIYAGKQMLRHRPLKNVMEELRIAKAIFPNLSEVGIEDDAFLVQSLDRIKQFSKEYKEKMGIKFTILTTPITFTLEKARLLTDAGMVSCCVGIQSASKRTRNEIFQRKDTIEDVMAVKKTVNQIQKETGTKIQIRYDVIVDNPWENNIDRMKTIFFILRLKPPINLAIFSLTFYPDTDLYKRASKNGYITDDLNQVYRRSQLTSKKTIMNGLLMLSGCGLRKAIDGIINYYVIRTKKIVDIKTSMKKFSGSVGEF